MASLTLSLCHQNLLPFCSTPSLRGPSSSCASNIRLTRLHTHSRTNSPRTFSLVAQAKPEGTEPTPSTVEYAAGIAGVLAAPVVAWSLYTLKTTGCGLPPGPGGSLGALEGVSFLVVFGLVGWSAFTKVKTGSGLPSGPFGLLGAAEGLSYLIVLASIIVFGLQILDYGYIPPPVPGEQCFG